MTGPLPNKFLQRSFDLAKLAYEEGEMPVGAVLVKDGVIISEAYNQTEKLGRFTAHAEMICIEDAVRKLRTKYLVDCELFITLEPCLMCQYAARLSRIQSITYSLPSLLFGADGRGYPPIDIQHHNCNLTPNVKALLQKFFEKKRQD